MPRKPDPRNEYHQNATAKSRKALVARPEANYVDAAISAAVYDHAISVARTSGDATVLSFIEKAAVEILLTWPNKSFDADEARRKVYARMRQRSKDDRSRFFAAARAVVEQAKTGIPPITPQK